MGATAVGKVYVSPMDTILRAKHRGIPQNDINFALLWGKMMSTPILVLSKASFLSQGNFPELYEIFIYDILSLLRSYIFV